jgi:hypothetical protein
MMLQDAMAGMILEGHRDTEKYRKVNWTVEDRILRVPWST